MLIGLLVAAIIVAYLIFMPELEAVHITLFFSFWFLSFVLDAWITLSNKHLIRYETNIILPILIRRYGSVTASILIFLLEISLMLAVSLLFTRTLSTDGIAVGALAFGTAHLLALISNLKFVKKNR